MGIPVSANSSVKKLDSNGHVIPEGISDHEAINGHMVNSGHIRYTKGTKGDAIDIDGFVDDQGTRQGATAVAAINRGWTGSYTEDGVSHEVHTRLVLAKSDAEKSQAILMLKPCPTSICLNYGNARDTARANIAGMPAANMYLTAFAKGPDYVHEFGHFLGMKHWYNGTGSVMAYDGVGRAGHLDMSRLIFMYSDPWRYNIRYGQSQHR